MSAQLVAALERFAEGLDLGAEGWARESYNQEARELRALAKEARKLAQQYSERRGHSDA